MPKTNAREFGELLPTAQCDFCDEFAGGTNNAFYIRYRETLRSRVILATGNFLVLPSIGQLLEGYLLILPRSHYRAMGEMPAELVTELADISACVSTTLSRVYGPCVRFEHGARTPENGGCGIYHAHLHVVPLVGAPDPVTILKQRFPYTELLDLSEIRKRSEALPSYLYYQGADNRLYLFNSGPLPSQYVRKLLADSLGMQEWNWRSAGKEKRLLATLDRLSGQFETERNAVHQPQPTNAIQQSNSD